MSAYVEIDRLAKRFGDTPVLDGVTLTVAEGEVLALLGPSGSGKTTLLRLLAGFETADRGRIVIAGRDVTGLAPAARGVGMVFQHYALFPHLTVAGNTAFGLETQRWDRARIERRVAEVLELVDLAGLGRRRVDELSGGQQQRVALARALAPGPRLLLLDEPLSNLDPALRERTRHQLLAALREVGITTVLVTHEQEEAFDLGDRVAVLERGRLQQVGRPEALYGAPATRFVATFVGRSSELAGIVVEAVEAAAGGELRVRLDLPGAAGEPPVWPATAVEPLAAGDACTLVARPESLRLTPVAGGGGFESPATPAGGDLGGALTGRVTGRRYGGPVAYYQVAVPALGERQIEVLGRLGAYETGQAVAVAPVVAVAPSAGFGGPGAADEVPPLWAFRPEGGDAP